MGSEQIFRITCRDLVLVCALSNAAHNAARLCLLLIYLICNKTQKQDHGK